MNRSVNQLSDIVNNGLCIGCGLCQSIAGKDKIEVTMTSKGRLEPKEISKITPEIFKKIVNVCPGTIVEGLPKKMLIKVLNMILFGVIIYLFVIPGLLTRK